LVSYK